MTCSLLYHLKHGHFFLLLFISHITSVVKYDKYNSFVRALEQLQKRNEAASEEHVNSIDWKPLKD